jgi:hypothetical protein
MYWTGFCTVLKNERVYVEIFFRFYEVSTLQLFYFPLTGWHYLKMCETNTETLDVIMEGLVRYSELKPILAICI